MKLVFAFLPVALLLVTGASATAPDPVRDRIIADARTQSPAALAFDRTMHVVQIGGGTRTVVNRVDRWDGKSWSLISVDGRAPTAADLKETAKAAAAPVPGYHRLAALLASASERSTDPQGRTVLIIPQLPPQTIVNNGTDISAHLKAEAIVVQSNGRPWVQRLTLTAREPFKMSWMLKVLTFEQVNDYVLDTSGRPRLASQANASNGTMFGISGGQTSEVTFAYR